MQKSLFRCCWPQRASSGLIRMPFRYTPSLPGHISTPQGFNIDIQAWDLNSNAQFIATLQGTKHAVTKDTRTFIVTLMPVPMHVHSTPRQRVLCKVDMKFSLSRVRNSDQSHRTMKMQPGFHIANSSRQTGFTYTAGHVRSERDRYGAAPREQGGKREGL